MLGISVCLTQDAVIETDALGGRYIPSVLG